jgi:serine protease Do
MKRLVKQISVLAIGAALLAPVSLLAQDEKKMEEKDKAAKDKSETQVITITRKGDKNEKTTVEINGDKIIVNGTPIEDLKDGDITVHRNTLKNYNGDWNWNGNNLFGVSENKAMLGVTTEKVDKGVEIQDVTDESAAEKAGLKEKDVITKIDDQKVEDPDALSDVIGKHKPGDKVKVTFLRDNKEQTVTAELTKWKGLGVYNLGNGFNYNFKMPDMNFSEVMPKIQGIPKVPQGNWNQLYGTMAGRPRLGLSVQDTDDGKGVKVIDVDDEGNAKKAGIKEDDLITEIDGKAVNSADEVARIVRGSREKNSMMFKINRGGKTQNIEVKIPRKLKTADL